MSTTILPGEENAPVLILTAISGPHAGSVLELPRDKPAVLGRMCGPLPLNDSKASAYHADLWHENGQWFVSDHQSRNGTYVNREQITGKTRIENGSLVQVGRTAFAVTILADASRAAGGSGAGARVTSPTGQSSTRARTVDAADENEAIAEAHGVAPAAVHVDLPSSVAEDLAQHIVAALRDASQASQAVPQELLKSILARLDRQEEAQARLLAAAAREPDPEVLLQQVAQRLDRAAQEQRDLLAQAAAPKGPSLADLQPVLAQILGRLETSQAGEATLAHDLRETITQSVTQSTREAAAQTATNVATHVATQFSAHVANQQITSEQSAATLKAVCEGITLIAEQQNRRDGQLEVLAKQLAAAGPESLRPALEPVLAQLREQEGRQEEQTKALQAAIQAATEAAAKAANEAAATGPAATAATAAALGPIAAALQENQARQEAMGQQIIRAIEAQAAHDEPTLQEIRRQLQQQASAQADVGAIVRELASRKPEPYPTPATPEQIATPLAEQLSMKLFAPLAERSDFRATSLQQALGALSQSVAARGDVAEPMLREVVRRMEEQAARHEELAAAVRRAAQTHEETAPAALAAAQVAANSAQAATLAAAQLAADSIAAQEKAHASQRDELTAAVREAARGQSPRLEALVAQVLVQMQDQAVRHEQLASMFREAAGKPTGPDPAVLRQIADRIAAQENRQDALLSGLGEIRQLAQQLAKSAQEAAAAPAQPVQPAAEPTAEFVRPLLERIVGTLETQHQRHDQLSRDMREAASRPASDPLLQHIVGRLDAQEARQEEILGAVRQSLQAPPVRPVLENLVACMERQETLLAQWRTNLEQSLQARMESGVAPAPAQAAAAETLAAQMQVQEERHNQLVAAVREAVRAGVSQADPALPQIAAQLEAQAQRQEQMLLAMRDLASARETSAAGEAPRDAAENANAATLGKIVDALAEQASRQEEHAAALKRAIESRPLRQESLMAQLIVQIQEQALRHEQLATLWRDASRDRGETHEPLLRQVADRLTAQAASLEQALAGLRGAATAEPERVAPMLEQLAGELRQQGQRHEQALAELRLATEAQAQRAPELLAPLADRLREQSNLQQMMLEAITRPADPAQALAPAEAVELFKQIAAQVEAQSQKQEQFLAVVREAQAAAATGGEMLLRQIAGEVEGQAQRHEQLLAAVRELARREAQAHQSSDEQARTSAGETSRALSELTRQLQAQEQNQAKLLTAVREAGKAAASSPVLDQIVARLETQAREHSELLSTLLAVRQAQLGTGIDRLTLTGAAATAAAAAGVAGPRLVLVPPPTGDAGPSTEPLLREIMADYDERNRRYSELSAAIGEPRPRPRRFVTSTVGKAASAGIALLLLGIVVGTAASRKSAPTRDRAGESSGEQRYASRDRDDANQDVPNAPSQQKASPQQRSAPQPAPTSVAAGPTPPSAASTDAIARAERAEGKAEAYRDLFGRIYTSSPGGNAGTGERLASNSNANTDTFAGNAGTPGNPGAPNLFRVGQIERVENSIESGMGVPAATPPSPYAIPAAGGLSRTQLAYKLAFETNMAMTIAGRVDPNTGRQIGGRTLNPAAARAKGVTRWEDWYRLDDEEDKRQIQQQIKNFEAQKKGQAPFNLGDPIRTMPPSTQPAAE